MYCKHCGKMISEDAKFCDGCGNSVSEETAKKVSVEIEEPKKKKKKKKRHPILGTIVLIFGIFMIIGAIGGGSEEPKKVDSSVSPSASVETTVPEVFTVGDTLEMDGVLVTLEDVHESNGAQFLVPSDGNVFVVCEFTIENNTNSEMAVSSMMSFEAYFDDYSATISISAMTADQSKHQLDGSVAAGKKINGVVGYEVPKDWSEMEIRFAPNAFSDKNFVFTYRK